MLNFELLKKAQERLDSLTKPQGSLGELEEIAKRLFAIYGGNLHRTIKSKAIFVAAGDHGIVAEGVSAFPQEVTQQMILNFIAGGAAISVLARSVNAKLFVADFGVAGDEHKAPVHNLKVRPSTRNFLIEDAMTRSEATEAISRGRGLVEKLHYEHAFDLIALGEMGIGNTTSASAIIAALTHRPISEITGKGTGVSDTVLQKKILVLERALVLRKPDSQNAMDVLAKVGGYEIAGLVGMYLAAAANSIPCVIDGLISGAAALVAFRIEPSAKNYFFASHQSAEPGHRAVFEELQLHPLIHGKLRLGEASGAALAIPLIENAWKLFTEMATFQSAGVSDKK
ncbi:MAG: nicotinate-nucleotide--dimethylbenzimidazole phosphoribosyltransferase [Candidatus Omnitrophica bacterium]|nr:nicotinate-nucleotide--dimethylbenzimidazole phosphoribosyltransferase [Candidatus Omnitrophota bacterium]